MNVKQWISANPAANPQLSIEKAKELYSEAFNGAETEFQAFYPRSRDSSEKVKMRAFFDKAYSSGVFDRMGKPNRISFHKEKFQCGLPGAINRFLGIAGRIFPRFRLLVLRPDESDFNFILDCWLPNGEYYLGNDDKRTTLKRHS